MMPTKLEGNRCPLCWDFGTKIDKKTFHCSKCNVSFDNFGVLPYSDIKEYVDAHWN